MTFPNIPAQQRVSVSDWHVPSFVRLGNLSLSVLGERALGHNDWRGPISEKPFALQLSPEGVKQAHPVSSPKIVTLRLMFCAGAATMAD